MLATSSNIAAANLPTNPLPVFWTHQTQNTISPYPLNLWNEAPQTPPALWQVNLRSIIANRVIGRAGISKTELATALEHHKRLCSRLSVVDLLEWEDRLLRFLSWRCKASCMAPCRLFQPSESSNCAASCSGNTAHKLLGHECDRTSSQRLAMYSMLCMLGSSSVSRVCFLDLRLACIIHEESKDSPPIRDRCCKSACKKHKSVKLLGAVSSGGIVSFILFTSLSSAWMLASSPSGHDTYTRLAASLLTFGVKCSKL